MTKLRIFHFAWQASLAIGIAVPLTAQTPASSKETSHNPLAGNANAIRQGAILFRQECVFCHGMGARGGARAPDLTTGAWSHGGSDADLFATISNGVPGTAMSGDHGSQDEIWSLVAYLRTLEHAAAAPVGDAHRGETLFFGTGRCSSCHMVKGRGGRLGPDLSYAGSARSRDYLIESIREPSRHLTENTFADGLIYDTVTATTPEGKRIVGIPINEDTFTVQVMDASERIYSLDKKSLKNLQHENRSMMPEYRADSLGDSDLEDLIAYLQSLRAPSAEKGAPGADH